MEKIKGLMIINGHELKKSKIGVSEYRVSAFFADKLQFQFNVSSQLTGKDEEPPTYQLTDKSQTIPEWINENLKAISDWIIKDAK